MSAQLEDGYTRIANEILERVYNSKFNGTQFSILLFVMRKTYGFQRKSRDMSLSFIATGIDTHKDQVKRELNKLIEWGVIKVFEEATFSGSRVIGFNKGDWNIPVNKKSPQGANQSTPDEKAHIQGANQSTPTGGELVPQIKKDLKETLKDIISFWLSCNLVKHKTITPQMELQIKWKLPSYSEEQLIESISNYDSILNNPDYQLEQKWGMDVFFMSHFEKFLTERDPFSYYPKKKPNTSLSTSGSNYTKPFKTKLEQEMSYLGS